MSTRQMTIIACDHGMRHIGIASGQSLTGTATPLTVIAAREGIPDWRSLDRLIAQWQPNLLVVGLPLNMDGSAGEGVEAVRRFARRLRARYRLCVCFMDERLTSREARERSDDPARRHAIAAQLIAEGWLARASSSR